MAKNDTPIEKQVTDKPLAKALVDFLTMDSRADLLYNNWFIPLQNNYVKKYEKGIYDDELALKGLRNLAGGIFKEYKVKILKNQNAKINFATKQAVAKTLLERIKSDTGIGSNAMMSEKKASKATIARLTIEKCTSIDDLKRFLTKTCGFKFDKHGINPMTYSVNQQDDIIEIHVVDNIDTPTLAKLQRYLTTIISYTVYQLIVQKDFQKFAIQRPKMSISGKKPKTSTYQVIYDKANPSKEILKKINALTYITNEQAIAEGIDLFNNLFDSPFGNESNDKNKATKNVNWNRYLTLFPDEPYAKAHLESLMKLKEQTFIHFVDDMIKYIKLDMSEENMRTKKVIMKIDVRKYRNGEGRSIRFIQPAIKKAVDASKAR